MNATNTKSAKYSTSVKAEFEITSLVECDAATAEIIRRKVTKALGDACKEAGIDGAYVGIAGMATEQMDLKWVSSQSVVERQAGEQTLARLSQLASLSTAGYTSDDNFTRTSHWDALQKAGLFESAH